MNETTDRSGAPDPAPMPPPAPLPVIAGGALAPRERGLHDRVLSGLLIGVTLAFVLVVLPFYSPVMWAAIIAIVFGGLNRRLELRLGGRINTASLLTLLLVLLIVILPLLWMAAAMVQEGASLVQRVQSGEVDFAGYYQRIVQALPAWMQSLLDRFGLTDVAAVRERIAASAARISQGVATQALRIGQLTLASTVDFFVMLYLAYFFLRDGPRLMAIVRQAIPLGEAHKRRLLQVFGNVVRATVKGNFVVALVQGVLTGIALAVLGIHGAMLWGAVTTLLSLLPAVGAAMVWLPVALYLMALGHAWQGIGLIVYGTVVIGLVDNLLRPLLVGKDIKLPDWLVLLSTLGGMALLGLNGFVIGPLVAALFIAVWHLYGRQRRGRDTDALPPNPPK